MWVNGEKHREGGEPAIVNSIGTKEWWYRGNYIERMDYLHVNILVEINGILMVQGILRKKALIFHKLKMKELERYLENGIILLIN